MRHFVILGETGAGKTSIARFMIPYFPRVLVLDRHWEYGESDGLAIRFGFERISQEIADNIHGSWRYSFRTNVEEEWGAISLLIYYIQEQLTRTGERSAHDPPDTLIIVEEAGLFASPHKLPDWMGHLWNYGRHYGICAIGIARADTEMNKIMRINSTMVFCRSTEITSGLRTGLGKEREEAITKLALYDFNRKSPPKPGTHYMTYPDSGDILQAIAGRRRLRVINNATG